MYPTRPYRRPDILRGGRATDSCRSANRIPSSGRVLLAFVLLLGATGCHPDGLLAWLPDSSGFVYATGDGVASLHHYDLVLDRWHTIVPDSQSYTTLPGVSP